MIKASIRLGLIHSFGGRGIPILTGAMRGKRLPKEIAEQHLSMLFGRYEPCVVSTILSSPGLMKVAYDIGAHHGFMTMVLAQRLGRGGLSMPLNLPPITAAS